MDPNALAGMVTTLILAAMVGGFILLYPLTRRLGALLEQRVQGKMTADPGENREVAQLREQVGVLERQVARLTERQEFTEQLVSEKQSRSLPSGL